MERGTLEWLLSKAMVPELQEWTLPADNCRSESQWILLGGHGPVVLVDGGTLYGG